MLAKPKSGAHARSPKLSPLMGFVLVLGWVTVKTLVKTPRIVNISLPKISGTVKSSVKP